MLFVYSVWSRSRSILSYLWFDCCICPFVLNLNDNWVSNIDHKKLWRLTLNSYSLVICQSHSGAPSRCLPRGCFSPGKGCLQSGLNQTFSLNSLHYVIPVLVLFINCLLSFYSLKISCTYTMSLNHIHSHSFLPAPMPAQTHLPSNFISSLKNKQWSPTSAAYMHMYVKPSTRTEAAYNSHAPKENRLSSSLHQLPCNKSKYPCLLQYPPLTI